ncbi:methyl-accepting chemotaxis protein [Endothiovibrio diazotrophicus]
MHTNELPSGPNRFGGRSVSFKITATLALVLALLTAISAYVIVMLERNALNDTLESSVEVVAQITEAQTGRTRASVEFNARQLGKLLAAIAPQPIAEFDLSLLAQYASMAMEDPDITYVAFLNNDGKPLAVAGDRTVVETLLKRKIVHEEIELGQVIVGYGFQRADEQLAEIDAKKEAHLQKMKRAQGDALHTSIVSSVVMFTGSTVVAILSVILLVRAIITKPLSRVVVAARRLGGGDLTAHIESVGDDELGVLGSTFNEMGARFRNVIVKLTDTATDLTASAEQMAAVTEQTGQGVKRQQAETEIVATAMNEMSATVATVAGNASRAADHANEASAQAVAGKAVVGRTVDSIGSMAGKVERAANVMHELEQHTVSIGTVIDVIKGIAEQTNLLALNAAIEAARAGEQGRGFAVVADEVRNLAQRTQVSTAEIQQIIERVQSGAEQAVAVMREGQEAVTESVEEASRAGASLDSIIAAVTSITDMTVQIAGAVEQQSGVAEEMNRNIATISYVAAETAKGSEDTAREGEKLRRLSHVLDEEIQKFRI